MGRDKTEERLESAALTLLRHEGILSGLNLRAVADAAGVNRGNVYHYFGSRRQLLQSALRRRLAANIQTVSKQTHATLEERFTWTHNYMIRQREAVEITALLILDGDEEIQVMQFKEDVFHAFQSLQTRGEIAEDIDLETFQVFITSLTRGYVLHRDQLAQETGRRVKQLDEDLLALSIRILSALKPQVCDE